LQEQRVAFARQKKGDAADGAAAANTHHLDGDVKEPKAIEKHAPIVGKRLAVAL